MTDIYRTEDKTLPAVCYALYLLAFATGITAIIGVIIAYTQREAAGPDMRTHYTYLIRTFWGALIVGLVCGIVGGVLFGLGALLSVILIGFPIMGAAWLVWSVVPVWFAVRCIVGLVYLSRGEPHPRPYATLV